MTVYMHVSQNMNSLSSWCNAVLQGRWISSSEYHDLHLYQKTDVR